MRLDLTVTLGNLLTIAGVALSVFLAYVKLREQLVSIETRLGPLWEEYTRRRYVRRLEDREGE